VAHQQHMPTLRHRLPQLAVVERRVGLGGE
jgi:hypothetical protein